MTPGSSRAAAISSRAAIATVSWWPAPIRRRAITSSSDIGGSPGSDVSVGLGEFDGARTRLVEILDRVGGQQRWLKTYFVDLSDSGLVELAPQVRGLVVDAEFPCNVVVINA